MDQIIEEAAGRARVLRDGNLLAALMLVQDSPDARFLLPVLQLPQDDRDNVRAAAQAERTLMCPELYRAAFSGAANDLRRLLEPPAQNQQHDGRCCSVDEVTAGWNTVLHIAAGQGHVNLVNGFFREARRAPAGIVDRVAALLPRGNSKSETALHVAASAGHHEMVSLLIMLAQHHAHGPGAARVLPLKNSRGDTALHVAARHGRQALAERLMVAAPALSCGVNDARVSPLYLAFTSRSAGIAAALVGCRHANASASGPDGQSALQAAVLQSAEITRDILLWDVNLARATDGSGSTPLHYAASDGDREIIGQLITSLPSALYLQDEQGFTPLHVAAWMGHVDAIRDMLQASPDAAEVTDNNGRNFLHVAIERGHESVVQYIVGSPFAGGVVNEQDNNGNTPLHTAVIAGKPKLAILQSEFLELNIANNEVRTPFDLVSDIAGFLPMIGFVLKLSAREAWVGTLRQDRVLPWRGRAMKEWAEKLSKNLGIVAVLIATIALTAMFNVPGGYDPKGMPSLGGTRPHNTFLVLDTTAVASSVIATMLLVYGRGASAQSSVAWICLALIFLWCALMSMILSFMAAIIPGLGKVTFVRKIIWCIFALPFFSLVALSFVWAAPAPTIASVRLLYRARTRGDSVRMTRHTGRRFPLLGFYLFALYLFWFLNAGAFALTLHVITTV